MAQNARHRPGQEGGADDQAMGGPVDDHSTRPAAQQSNPPTTGVLDGFFPTGP